ncbi:GGDEF and EAL domain-containing protein [Pseudorhodoferax sp. LjRoot39]|uniref:sensor domain-containing protein n=1 Tax=Pseudorhodoferax sp. LjRoot39 TaxID=3342328 RepID=UPI003ECE4D41
MNHRAGHNPTAQQLAQLRALDDVMAIAEFAPDGTLRRANAHYLALLGCTADVAVGSHHSRWCTPGAAASTDYAGLWEALRRGQAQAGPIERERMDGSSCWLQSTYAPVLDASGEVTEVLEVAADVTERLLRERADAAHLRRLSLASDTSDAAVVVTDAQARILYVNASFTRLLGWRADEVAGQDAVAWLLSNQDAVAIEAFRATLRSGRPVERERIALGKDGQSHWVKVISHPIFDELDGRRYTVSVYTDITQAKVHAALQHRVLEAMARERPLAEVLELICRQVEHLAPEVCASILEVDEQGLLHPLAAPSLPASYSQQLDGLPIGPATGSCGTAAWRNAPVMVDDIATDPLWAPYRELILPLGYTGCWSTPIRNSQGGVLGTFAFYFRKPRNPASAAFHQRLVDSCTHLCALALQRERTRQHIRQLAFYDSLTGLPNRSLLHARADQAIAAAARSRETLAVLFVDLDRFKQVNDSLGHPAGDAVLRHAAAQLQLELRASDIAGRLSGDEFVVVLPQCDAGHAAEIAARLQALLAAPLAVGGSTLSVTASVGVAMFPEDGRTMDALLQRADMAMYQAKTGGRGRFCFFSAGMNDVVQQRLALETALRQAMGTAQMQLHYQPQIDMASGRLHGVEALARWTHPTLGEIEPARFIPLAEDCGLIAELGRWALHQACRQLAQWRSEGLTVPSVSVNLSPTSFHDRELTRTIAQMLAQHALAPQDLMLELTESVLLDTNPSTMQTITEVRALGVRMSMDDFGTGYSSLSYLRRLPVDEIKLDRSFVADLESDGAARALSNAVLEIGRSLKLTVVAEGVETMAQDSLLRAQGYAVAQGYLVARPMAGDALAAWLAHGVVPPAGA